MCPAWWSYLVFIGGLYGFRCPPLEVGRAVGGQPVTGDLRVLVKGPRGTGSEARCGEQTGRLCDTPNLTTV